MASGTLFVVATPLGRLDDISAHARAVLAATPCLYAEDTRRSRVLLQHLGIATVPTSLHVHNEAGRVAAICARLQAGDDVALLSDAGTPGVSDPGAYVVAAAHAAGLPVSPVVGPSALAAAVSVAGFAGAAPAVLFVGFLPARGTARAAAWRQALRHDGVVVLFEAPHRLVRALDELAAAAFAGELCVCRELSKQHEEVVRGTLAALRARFAAAPPRGEITVVLGPQVRAPAPAADDAALDAALARALAAGLSARDAVAAVAAVLALPRRRVYARQLAAGDPG